MPCAHVGTTGRDYSRRSIREASAGACPGRSPVRSKPRVVQGGFFGPLVWATINDSIAGRAGAMWLDPFTTPEEPASFRRSAVGDLDQILLDGGGSESRRWPRLGNERSQRHDRSPSTSMSLDTDASEDRTQARGGLWVSGGRPVSGRRNEWAFRPGRSLAWLMQLQKRGRVKRIVGPFEDGTFATHRLLALRGAAQLASPIAWMPWPIALRDHVDTRGRRPRRQARSHEDRRRTCRIRSEIGFM
jgi:hypothetical protein